MSQPSAAELLAAIQSGKTLYVQTATRVTPINAKTVAAFDAAGTPILREGLNGHLYMAQGRRYVDCHYANLMLR